MATFDSPLRYPGGKAVLFKFLSEVIIENGLQDCVYVEPYAGGAGASLKLLFSEHVESILICDVDSHIFAFWHSILHQTKRFLDMIENAPVTMDEWRKQRKIYLKPERYSRVKVGFATFFLNRCNRSGIINGGPIGGVNQSGRWKLNARFNKKNLALRIQKIALYKERISVFNMNAINFLRQEIIKGDFAQRALVFLDPPYYVKGSNLYLNHYKHKDHELLAKFIKKQKQFRWLLSYDNVPQIRKLYSGLNHFTFKLRYSAHSPKIGSELLVYDKTLGVSRAAKAILKKNNIPSIVA